MKSRSLRARGLGVLAAAAMVGAMLALSAASATAAVTCPIVDATTHAVSPAPTPGVDWSGCDLSSANLAGADLSNADLSNADLNVADLNGANLSGADMTDAFVEYAVLSDADLSSANLSGATLSRTTLTGVTLNSDTNFTNAKFYGLISGDVVGVTTLPANWNVTDHYFVGPSANLTSAELAGAAMAGADLTSATLHEADLTGADLSGAVLHGANLSSADLTDAVLKNADLTSANLSSATLTGADVAGVQMNFDTVLGFVVSGQITGTPASFNRGWMLVSGYLLGQWANLSDAQLAGADMASADLGDANLAGADLQGADLQNADLSVANLEGTKLFGANLDGMISGQVSGNPASLPANWSVHSGYLLGPDVDLFQATLTGADLSGLDLAGMFANSANLSDANLDGADLDSAHFLSANLTGATFAGASLTGVTWSDTTCPDGSNSDKHVAGCFSPLDTTPPVVKVTGVRAGQVYLVSDVPTPGCVTTDNSFVAVPATLKVTTAGKKGVGSFTATCSGAVDRAGNRAAPVSVTYKIVYGFDGFISPGPGSTLARSGHKITVTFRLTGSLAKPIYASTAAALAKAHEVAATLRGPGISAATAVCGWNTSRRYFQCVIRIPSGTRTGAKNRYTISAYESLLTSAVVAPSIGVTPNPETIHFR